MYFIFFSVFFLATPWTAAYQAPLSMGFARQEYWSGLPLPSPMNIQASKNNFSFLFVYLDTSGLSCFLRNLQSWSWPGTFVVACEIFSLWHAESFVAALKPLRYVVGVCGIQFPSQGWNLGPLHRELGLLATAPIGKSPGSLSNCCDVGRFPHVTFHLSDHRLFQIYLFFWNSSLTNVI